MNISVRLWLFGTFFLFSVITSCRKHESFQIKTTSKSLIRAIDYPLHNARAEYTYNTDSSLANIRVTRGPSGYEVRFTYQDNQVSKVFVSSSMYETVFHYQQGRIIREISSPKHQPNLGYKLDFEYNSAGRVSVQKYYHMNEAGSQLQYTSRYQYDASGLPKQIISTSGNTSITWIVEEYSEEADFTPWSFIDISLDELYEVYNYPVLSQLNRLPKKITQLVKIGDTNPYTEKEIKVSYSIEDKKLKKTITSISYPDHPEFDSNSEIRFHY